VHAVIVAPGEKLAREFGIFETVSDFFQDHARHLRFDCANAVDLLLGRVAADRLGGDLQQHIRHAARHLVDQLAVAPGVEHVFAGVAAHVAVQRGGPGGKAARGLVDGVGDRYRQA